MEQLFTNFPDMRRYIISKISLNSKRKLMLCNKKFYWWVKPFLFIQDGPWKSVSNYDYHINCEICKKHNIYHKYTIAPHFEIVSRAVVLGFNTFMLECEYGHKMLCHKNHTVKMSSCPYENCSSVLLNYRPKKRKFRKR